MWGLRGRQEKKEEWRSSQDGQRGLPPETKMAPGQVFFCEAHPHPMGSWTPSATGQQPPGTSCSLRTSIPLCSRPSQHLNLSQLWSSEHVFLNWVHQDRIMGFIPSWSPWEVSPAPAPPGVQALAVLSARLGALQAFLVLGDSETAERVVSGGRGGHAG